mgnify:CR=1 FL=1
MLYRSLRVPLDVVIVGDYEKKSEYAKVDAVKEG